jgi:hypothetical protein
VPQALARGSHGVVQASDLRFDRFIRDDAMTNVGDLPAQ